MASYTLAAGDHGAYDHALTANVVDTVTFAREVEVEVVTDGSASVFFTVDGTTPAVGGQSTWEVPAFGGGASRRTVTGVLPGNAGGTVVKLISSGTPRYSVTGSA